MRTIKIKLTTQANPVSIETSATYLSEFKSEPKVQELGINWGASKLIDKDSKITMELDDTLLPAGDAYFFVFPTKTNSGADYNLVSYGDLRQLCAKRLPKGVISATPTKSEMIRALTSMDNEKSASKVNATEVVKPVEEGKEVILYNITTSETLTKEYEDIAKRLK